MRKKVTPEPKAPVVDKKEAKELKEAGLTIEKGNFVFGKCASCDWTGKARRSRSSAEKDAHDHSKDCKGKGKVSVEHTEKRVAKQ